MLIRVQGRFEALAEEVGHTRPELQLLRPMAGREEEAGQRVRHGLDPGAGLTQAQWATSQRL